MSTSKENTNKDSGIQKEWDEISCPICLDHPHNAVLLICTAHKNGCRSYICDTSHHHSNCLDRFKNLQLGGSNSSENSSEAEKMMCPLCRGNVTGWEVVKEARQYWNAKARSCSQESCAFSGNYKEIGEHARRVHPTSRSCDVDPRRQRAWRQMEQERDFGDLLSFVRTAMPGAVMLGDYALDNVDDGDELSDDVSASWWATMFLYHVLNGPFGPGNEPRVPPRTRRRRGSRYLWGESLLGLRQDEDANDDSYVSDDGVRRPRRRRRTLSREDEEQ